METTIAMLNMCVVLCLVSLASFPGLIYSCACMPYAHPQAALCHASFVIKANVKKSKVIYSKQIMKTDGQEPHVIRYPFQIRYFLHLSKTFKVIENLDT